MKIIIYMCAFFVAISCAMHAQPFTGYRALTFTDPHLTNYLTDPYTPESIVLELLPDADVRAPQGRRGVFPALIKEPKLLESLKKICEPRGETVIVLIDENGRLLKYWIRKLRYYSPVDVPEKVSKDYKNLIDRLEWHPATHGSMFRKRNVSMIKTL